MPIHHIALAILVMMLWGGNFVAIKVGLDSFPPLLFSSLRFFLCALPLIFIFGSRDTKWSIIISFGIALGVMKFSALFIGIDIGVPAGLASLVLQCQAFFTVILAMFLFDEKVGMVDWLGMSAAAMGMVVISLSMPGAQSIIGLGLVIIAGAAWAVANMIMKQAGNINMFRLITYMSLVPPLPLLALSFIFEGQDKILHSLGSLNITGVLCLLYVVVVATIFGFMVWGFLLRSYPAASVAPFTLLVPVFGIALTALFLGEKLNQYQIAGAGCVMFGLFLINIKHFRKQAYLRS